MKAGDFSGPTGLKHLNLANNDLKSLPQDLFDGLTSLEDLNFASNQITVLPEDLFSGLTNLKLLSLSTNPLTGLHENLFDGLTRLERLEIIQNGLTTLPEDLFDGLISLKNIFLPANKLSSLPENLVSGLTNLEYLSLFENLLTGLPENLFDGLTYLHTLDLHTTSLTSLPEKLFDHVTLPQKISVLLCNSSIACLPLAIINNPAVSTIPENIRPCAVTATLSLSPASISENGGRTTVTATLDKAPSSEVVIAISAVSQDPALASDYTLTQNKTLTIAAGATTSTGTVTIKAMDNAVAAPDKIITIQGTASNLQEILGPAGVTLTITDDDVRSLAAPTSVAVTEGRSTPLPVALSAQPTADVTVTVAGHAATDLTPNPTVLTFTLTTWATAQTVRLGAAEDGVPQMIPSR